MDYRVESFNRKFSSAKKYLSCSDIKEIISIKYRGVTNSSDYNRLINELNNNHFGFKIDQVVGDFQGTSWKITDQNQNSVIIVEHETGLEILYIAGSIASLLSLISLINTGWKYLHNRFFDRPSLRDNNSGIEIRTFDKKNKLIEKHVINIEDYILTESLQEIIFLKKRVNELELELKKINEKKVFPKKTKTIKKGKKVK